MANILKNKKFYFIFCLILTLLFGAYCIYKKISLKNEIVKIEESYLKTYSRKKFIKATLRNSDFYDKAKLAVYIDNNFDLFLKSNENLSNYINNYVGLYENSFKILNNLKKMKAISSKDNNKIIKYLNSFKFNEIINKLAYITLKNNSSDILAEKKYFEGIIYELNFDYEKAKHSYLKAKELNSYAAKYYKRLGNVYFTLYEFTSAVNVFENGLNIANFSNKKDKNEEMSMLYDLARSYSVLNNKNKTFTAYSNLLVNAINSNNQNYEWLAIYNLAFIEATFGNYDVSLDYLKYALKLSTKIRNKEYIANSLNALSKIYYRYGDYDNGKRNGLKAIKFAKKISNLGLIADSSINTCLNYEYLYIKSPENSYREKMVNIYCGRAIRINDVAGKIIGRPEYYIQNGFIYSFIGGVRDYNKSLNYYHMASDISQKYGLLLSEIEALIGISNDNISLNDNESAILNLNKLQKMRSSLNINSRLSYEYRLGFIYWNMKNYNKALFYYKNALLLAYNENDNSMISLLSSHIASINYEIGNYDEALKYSLLASEVNKKIYRYDHHYIEYQSLWNKNIIKELNQKNNKK